VLVVEDDPAALKAMLGLLTLGGFETMVSSTLAGGFDHLTALPDLVLTDLTLPDGNGVELLKRVRRRNQGAAVALICGGDDTQLAEAAALRPDAIFRKPLDRAELISWLDDPRPRSFGAGAPATDASSTDVRH
jgi:DNA-binding response OmpR family regulator